MILNLEFLSFIKEPIICSFEGQNVEYINGKEAQEFYMSNDGMFAVRKITTDNGLIKVYIEDKTKEPNARNLDWMEKERARTGREPSFF